MLVAFEKIVFEEMRREELWSLMSRMVPDKLCSRFTIARPLTPNSSFLFASACSSSLEVKSSEEILPSTLAMVLIGRRSLFRRKINAKSIMRPMITEERIAVISVFLIPLMASDLSAVQTRIHFLFDGT